MCVSVGDRKNEEQIRMVEPLIPGEEGIEGSGDYGIIDNSKTPEPRGGEKKPTPVVARRGDAVSARERAEELARENASAALMISRGLPLSWKVVNDGTRPGNTQVYYLMAGNSWTGFGVHGPHIGKEEK
jgi:hypothetical protein